MNMNQVNHSQADEMQLRTMFNNMWATRKPVLVALLIVTLGYWGAWAVKQLSAPSFNTYSRVILFTFDGVVQGRYLDGAPFGVNDVIMPHVLSRVYDVNDLAEQGVSRTVFVQCFNIQAYTPDYNLIVKKYEVSTKRVGISSEDIETLRAQMKSELKQASASSALLSFTPGKKMRLRESRIDKILLDVPRLWAETVTERRGAINPEAGVFSAKLFDVSHYESLDYLSAVDLAMQNSQLLLDSIDGLLKDFGSNTVKDNSVKDDETGYNLVSMKALIRNERMNSLPALKEYVLWFVIPKYSADVVSRYRVEISRLEKKRKYELLTAKSVQKSLEQYAALQPSGGDLEYLRKLFEKMLAHERWALSQARQIEGAQLIIDNLLQRKDNREENKGFVALFKTDFRAILDKMSEYANIVNRIYGKYSRSEPGHRGTLYKTAGADKMKVTGLTVTTRETFIYVLLAVMTLFGTMMIVTLVRWLKNTT